MRRKRSLLFLVILLCFSWYGQAQLWSGIIAPSRATDWSRAGVEGGIPSGSWTQCGSTIAAGASAATINTAISNCGTNQYVLLGPGTFNISGLLINKSNVAVRGSGADQTTLVVSSENPNTSCQIGSFGGAVDICTNSGSTSVVTWTAGYSLGTTQITLSSVSGVSVGTVIVLSQNDDASDGWPATGDMYVCEDPAPNCSRKAGGSDFLKPSDSTHGTAEWVRVTAINQGGCGSTCVTIDPPVTLPNFRSGQSPTATIYASGSMISRSGVENLSVDGTSVGVAFKLVRCDNCWVKGVRGILTNTGGSDIHVVAIVDSFHDEVRDSYFYGDFCPTGCINNYQDMPSWVGSLKFENNVMQGVQADFIPDNGPMTNSVIAYNFITGNPGTNIDLHNEGDMMNLWEGNIWGGFWGDVTHGTHFFETLYRNACTGNRYASGTGNVNSCVQFETNNRFMNVVGNVMGGVSEFTTYEVTEQASGNCGSTAIFNLGSAGCNSGSAVTTDSNVKRTLMRWANWDSVTKATRFCGNSSDTGWSTTCSSTSEVPSGITNFANPVPTKGDTGTGQGALPASFYLSGKPSWWRSMPFPAIGPDVTGGIIPNMAGHAYTNPAADCYLNVMRGSPDGSGNALTFNADTCYARGLASAPTPPANLSAVVQ